MFEHPGRLDFSEALKDSPRFRLRIWQHEQSLAVLEAKLRDAVRLCETMVEFGKTYVASFCNFASAIDELNAVCFCSEPTVAGAFGSVAQAFAHMIKFQKVLVEQAHWSIIKNLNDFLNRELGKVLETRAQFARVSAGLDEATARHAQTGRRADASDARNEMTALGTCFAHTALDYVFQLRSIRSHKDHEILESFFSFLRACQTFFHQGHEYFVDWEDKNKLLVSETITTLKQKSKQVERKMQDRHLLVPKDVFEHQTGMPLEADVVMEGYLFKRATNAFRTWHRRWFVIRADQLLYCHRAAADAPAAHAADKLRVTGDGYTVMESDLRLCLVRPSPPTVDRNCCFELVTPTKSHMLQADSESLCDGWIKALQRSIDNAYQNEPRQTTMSVVRSSCHRLPVQWVLQIWPEVVSQSSSSSGEGLTIADIRPDNNGVAAASSSSPKIAKPIEQLRDVAGNEFCADCGSANPKWASVNVGVTLCIECCGIHRSLGVQVSKVRSLTLDAWEPEHVRLMRLLGNDAVNAAYLAHKPHTPVPPEPKPNSPRPVREAWICAKYVEKRFARPSSERARDQAEHRLVHQRPLSPQNKLSLAARKNRALSVSANFEESSERDARRLSVKLFSSAPNLHRLTSVVNDSDIVAFRLPLDALMAAGGDVSNKQKRLSTCGSDTALDSRPKSAADTGAAAAAAETSARNGELLSAVERNDLRAVCSAVVQGAEINCRETLAGRQTTPLHVAVETGSVEALEYLLLNGAKINVVDSNVDTPLHVACAHGHTKQVCQLMKRNAVQDIRNSNGKTPLDIAVDLADADIVTLLRLTKLREEISRTEFSDPIEKTVMGVMDDISQMANALTPQPPTA